MSLPLLVSRENARTQQSLALLSGLSVRDVQAAIEQARREGLGICSGPEGVWLPEDADDLAASNRRLRSRVLEQLRTYNGQKRAEREMRLREEQTEEMSLWGAA